MNDVNLHGATLKLAEVGTHIPKGTEVLVKTSDKFTGTVIRVDNYKVLPYYDTVYIIEHKKNITSGSISLNGGVLAGDTYSQVSVIKDSTYTAKFILYPAYRGDITVPGLPEDIAQEIVQRYEEKFKVILIKGSDGIAHIIPTDNISRVSITKETA